MAELRGWGTAAGACRTPGARGPRGTREQRPTSGCGAHAATLSAQGVLASVIGTERRALEVRVRMRTDGPGRLAGVSAEDPTAPAPRLTVDEELPRWLGDEPAEVRAADGHRIRDIGAAFAMGVDHLATIGPAVTVFGSARTPPDDPDYALMRAVGGALGRGGYAVITGGGGLMKAREQDLLGPDGIGEQLLRRRLDLGGAPRFPSGPQIRAEQAMAPREAFFAATELVPFTTAAGRVSAELVTPYPPGIPAVAPGELYTRENVDYLQAFVEAAGFVEGAADPMLQKLRVVAR